MKTEPAAILDRYSRYRVHCEYGEMVLKADALKALCATLEQPLSETVGEGACAHRQEVNTILGKLLAPLGLDLLKRIEIENRACTEIIAHFASTPPPDQVNVPAREEIASGIARVAGCQINSERTKRLTDYFLALLSPNPTQDNSNDQ